MRHLDDLIEQRTQVSNHLSEGRLTPVLAASAGHAGSSNRDHQRASRVAFRATSGVEKQRELLDSIPGIGPEMAARLLAEMPQLAELGSARDGGLLWLDALASPIRQFSQRALADVEAG
jgi:hypothetical protein